MAKFILVGGYLAKAQDSGKGFADELVKGLGDAPKLLLCLFARVPETWNSIFEKESVSFRNYLPEKKLDIQLASPEEFIEQVRWADAIYIRGGITKTLIRILKESPGWERELNGKILAGSSAGADVICKYHYNLDERKVGEGLGLLPLKIIPHWKSDYDAPNIDWDKAYAELKDYKEDLPLLTLAEGQFEVRTV